MSSISSLPDDVIHLLFSHLEGDDISGIHGTPRHAFALAQTNKRFLSLYSQRITRIAPGMLNSMNPKHSPMHLLSIARLAGHSLREVHLKGCYETIPVLSKSCPSLEVLSLIDDEGCSKQGLTEILLRRSLRSLSVTNPTFCFLNVLRPLPRELCLFNIPYTCQEQLARVLEHPPTKLCLTFPKTSGEKMLSARFIQLLDDAVPRIESFELDLCAFSDMRTQGDFKQEASALVSLTRENIVESMCMTIKLAGKQSFRFFNGAHPTSSIELTKWQQTYGSNAEGVFAKCLPLIEACRPYDFSKLQKISIGLHCKLQLWATKLENLNIKHMTVESLDAFKSLSITVDTVEITENGLLSYVDQPLRNVSQLRIRKPTAQNLVDPGFQSLFFFQLHRVMCCFKGESVWIEEMEPILFSKAGHTVASRENLSLLVESVEIFEVMADAGFHCKKGAVTVKGLIDTVLRGWSLTENELAALFEADQERKNWMSDPSLHEPYAWMS